MFVQELDTCVWSRNCLLHFLTTGLINKLVGNGAFLIKCYSLYAPAIDSWFTEPVEAVCNRTDVEEKNDSLLQGDWSEIL